MSERAYFDWNATAPLREEARSAVVGALGATGNPSSGHEEGRAARRLVEEARVQVAALAGAEFEERHLHVGRHRSQHAGADPGAGDRGREGPT